MIAWGEIYIPCSALLDFRDIQLEEIIEPLQKLLSMAVPS